MNKKEAHRLPPAPPSKISYLNWRVSRSKNKKLFVDRPTLFWQHTLPGGCFDSVIASIKTEYRQKTAAPIRRGNLLSKVQFQAKTTIQFVPFPLPAAYVYFSRAHFLYRIDKRGKKAAEHAFICKLKAPSGILTLVVPKDYRKAKGTYLLHTYNQNKIKYTASYNKKEQTVCLRCVFYWIVSKKMFISFSIAFALSTDGNQTSWLPDVRFKIQNYKMQIT